jgi:predicted LPLAT superfamily acyltransferase
MCKKMAEPAPWVILPRAGKEMESKITSDILFVIPVFNHGGTLSAVVRSALATNHPVLVVDDGSTDGGVDALTGLDCRLIRSDCNKGKGAAILAGAREAERLGYRAIVTIDADGQHAPQDALRLVEKDAQTSGNSVIIGVREMQKGGAPAASLFGRAFSNFWVRLECGLDLVDTQSGLRLYPVLEILSLELSRSRYDFETEVLVKSAWAGIPISTVPVSVYYPEGKTRISHFHRFKDNFRLTLLHISLLLNRLLWRAHKKSKHMTMQGKDEPVPATDSSTLGRQLEFTGHSIFYLILRLFGLRGGYGLLFPTVLFYVLFSRKIHRRTKPYLHKRFPTHGPWQYAGDTIRNVLSFGRVLVDRGWLGCASGAAFSCDMDGLETLQAITAEGKGAILLTAHVGNWQTALAHLRFLTVPVHVMMHYDQQDARKHYFDLGKKQRGFAIITTDGPFGGMIEATAALQRGEFVTVMGDRHIKGPFSNVDFLGRKARFPNAAYTLAAHLNVPVVVLLSAKTGARGFQLRVWDVLHPQFGPARDRQSVLDDCCRKFARALEKYLKIFPYQWYNFYDFWGS